MAISLMSKKPVQEPLQPQDKYVLRLPDGMRDRIKKSAEANKRSMNAEIVQALEEVFPPEPDVIDVLDQVHRAIEAANYARGMPYRTQLIDALDKLSERLTSGLEFDQYAPKTRPPGSENVDGFVDRIRRWRRASATGVETSDLQRELTRGMLDRLGRDVTRTVIARFKEGRPEHALKILRLADVRFADPEAAVRAITDHLRKYFADNWGDPDAPEEEEWARDSD
ncbi:Arc family DNA-binding protein [Mesorhizobium sp. L2C067A000]|uniref:Arc family DNA-binding protein n=1 Tax=Mesorhizobium sp. L2C067A000 TaxID=1287106 RepID=UPI0003D04700|nr:Arc family DNA-binding protein [Mesorhizobium sp. L2C067A000]ESZ37373.1 regulatory protein [Mesorhizobium sp. L2C067A000]